MNLGRVKSFLIFIFLAINIYFIASLVMSSEFRIDDTTINNTVSILKNSGIKIDKSIIPKKAVNLMNIDTANIIYADKFKESPHAEGFTISNDSFLCTVENIELFNQKDSKIIKEIKNYLKDSGFNDDFMEFSKILYENGEKSLEIRCVVADYCIFDSLIKVKVTPTNYSLYGMWYEPSDSRVISNSRTRKTVYITSILMDIIENKDFKSNGIISIEMGYLSGSLYGTSGHITATALPVYRLTDKDNNIYYYDAADGTYNNSVSKAGK